MFCVEIKPKQGWRFNETPADERQFQKLFDLDDHSLATCRYCAMQHLKVSGVAVFDPVCGRAGQIDSVDSSYQTTLTWR